MVFGGVGVGGYVGSGEGYWFGILFLCVVVVYCLQICFQER